MLSEVLSLAHQLWRVDEPTPDLLASLFGVALEPTEQRPTGYQHYRADHRLGAIKAGFGRNGGFIDLRINFRAGAYELDFAHEFGVPGDMVLNPGLASQNRVFHRMDHRFEMWWALSPFDIEGVQFRWSFVPRYIYLHNYDHPRSHLQYAPFHSLTREIPADPAHRITLGAYVIEHKRYIGVYASPTGPVFFHENDRFDGPFGSVSVTIDNGKYRLVEGRRKVEIPYTPRTGLQTNPYDTEQHDIDLVALMVRGAADPNWWAAYTRPWVM